MRLLHSVPVDASIHRFLDLVLVAGRRRAKREYDVPDSLAWSPDGTQLVAPASSNGLLVLDTVDGTSRVIDSDEPVTAVAWSPDGRTVAASHTWFLSPHSALGEMTPTNGTWWWENRTDQERPGGIYFIDVDGGTVQEVVSTQGIAHVHGWSSDGRLLAYSRIAQRLEACGARGLFDRGASQLDAGPGERGSADQGAGWSPDGQRLAALIEQFDEEHEPDALDGGCVGRGPVDRPRLRVRRGDGWPVLQPQD